MAQERLSKKELVQPDRFQEAIGGSLEWAHHHPKEVAGVGVGLLLVILVIGIAFGRTERSVDTKGGTDVTAALKLLERDVRPAGATPSGDEPTFATEQEKQEAVAKALADARAKHAGSPAASYAALPHGDALYKLGRHDEALKAYDDYLAKAPADDALRFLALEGRALALEAKGDLAGAITAFDKLSAEVAAHKDRALYGKARLLEKQQKWDEARKTYEQLKTEHADSPVTRLGAERLATLNALHPAAPAGATPGTPDKG